MNNLHTFFSFLEAVRERLSQGLHLHMSHLLHIRARAHLYASPSLFFCLSPTRADRNSMRDSDVGGLWEKCRRLQKIVGICSEVDIKLPGNRIQMNKNSGAFFDSKFFYLSTYLASQKAFGLRRI